MKQPSFSGLTLSRFCFQISMLLKSATPLPEGLLLMAKDSSNLEQTNILSNMSKQLEEGLPFSQVMKESHAFPSYVLHMTLLGEQTGTLDITMERLSEYYEQEHIIYENLRRAITSPMIMLNTMSVAYSCPNDAEVTVDAVGDNSISATVSGSAEEWLVFVRKAGDASREYRKVTDGKIEADGLDTRTDYEIGVTKVCEPGDTALVKIVTVTTTGGNCGMPQDVAVVPGKFDATATWTGEASAYNVRYRVYGTERWAEEQVTANTITVGGLTSSTRYELAVQSVCSRAEGDTSAYTTPVEFTTLVETCLPPENVAVVPASESATVTWTGEADKYQVGCTLAGGTETLAIVEGSEFAITGLQPDADYAVRVRAICAEGDTSRWSSTVAFSTEPLAECVTPANLAVSDITDNSATLSWTADGGNTGWNLRWRASSVTSWTNVEGIAATSYQLTGLQPNTLYIWSVQAVCDAGRTSGWSVQNRFTTLLADGIGDIGIDDIRIFVKGKTLNVVNPSGGVIKSVSVYDAAGRTIASFAAGTDENVFIPLSVEGTVIVKVCGEKQAKTVQVVVN